MHSDGDLDREIMVEFVVEIDELLGRLDQELIELEEEPREDTLASVFRSMHTIKGSAGFLGLTRMELTAHSSEALLSRVRAGTEPLTPAVVDSLLRAVDDIRDAMAVLRTQILGEDTELPIAEPSELPAHVELTESVAPTLTTDATNQERGSTGTRGNPTKHGEYESIRVDVDVLDDLMTVVSELVLTRNRLRNELVDATGATKATLGRLSALTSDLQSTVMKTRMQPIAQLFGKYPRIVRDLSAALNKTVRLDVSGGDTELDRALIDAFRDPLTHLVRNAIDHGAESPEVRLAAGKDPVATISLSARHESGYVVVSITDDGAGLDYNKIHERAVERGLVSSDSRPSPVELANLIFSPGFSTADTVTNVSGRGVGMDVVRTQIEAIGGSVAVESTPGEGTRINAVIPLTLAILPSLLVRCSSQTFAIAQSSVEELVVAKPAEWESLAGAPILRLRNELLPLVFLSEVFGLPEESNSRVVVVKEGGLRYGIVVDESPGTEEIVIKPLDPLLSNMSVYSGTTILPNGTVALVLDIPGLAVPARVMASAAEPYPEEEVTQENANVSVVFLQSGDRLAAIDLADVERLEEFPGTAVQYAAGRSVVRYRDGLLPLYPLPGAQLPCEGAVQAIVLRDTSTDLGLRGIVVDQIVDIGPAVLIGSGNSSDVRAEVLHNNQVADLLETRALVGAVS